MSIKVLHVITNLLHTNTNPNEQSYEVGAYALSRHTLSIAINSALKSPEYNADQLENLVSAKFKAWSGAEYIDGAQTTLKSYADDLADDLYIAIIERAQMDKHYCKVVKAFGNRVIKGVKANPPKDDYNLHHIVAAAYHETLHTCSREVTGKDGKVETVNDLQSGQRALVKACRHAFRRKGDFTERCKVSTVSKYWMQRVEIHEGCEGALWSAIEDGERRDQFIARITEAIKDLPDDYQTIARLRATTVNGKPMTARAIAEEIGKSHTFVNTVRHKLLAYVQSLFTSDERKEFAYLVGRDDAGKVYRHLKATAHLEKNTLHI